MEVSTTIKQMLAGNHICVPNYQRAYSWDTNNNKQEVNTFLTDLEDYNRSTTKSKSTKSKYYFGHFLFEEKSENKFGIIDGQQRLTTIVIFLSTLFNRLKQIRTLDEKEEETFEDIIKRKSTYRFATVDYDNQLFKDYVVDQIRKDKNGLETESARRIVNAFDFFSLHLKDKDESYLRNMLDTVQNASCTTHPVKDESEAIQMFIFQNNRGKRPSNLEIIKAQFMFSVHLNGDEEKEILINDIKERFEKIYKSISSIEYYNIREDDVLLYTLRVHFNSLTEENARDKIDRLLSEGNPIPFIKEFIHSLESSFNHLEAFFGKDERENFEIHSLISLGGIGIAIPFIIKAYHFGIEKNDLLTLCKSLESLVLRHRLIGTKAYIRDRLNDVYQKFKSENPDITPITLHINGMKDQKEYYWWSHWNNERFKDSLDSTINNNTAKFLLWKYENHLESQGKSGYKPTRFHKIIKPHLEHIAPKTENPESGYDTYDEEFKNKYLDCLGNYLLLSEEHNIWASNRPFAEKRAEYNQLVQQREIQEMTEKEYKWTKEKIDARHKKIVEFVLSEF
ncbi:MAG: DUF262 domain-containing HNH endonuclease family protein [Ekhidna sp.]|nr:DUF262 domain-containing HNH endonuclease family protein [Ekhidna sp.]